MKLYRVLIILLFIAASALFGCGAALNAPKNTRPISAQGFHLDTLITITIYDSEDERVFEEVFAEIKRLEGILSATVENSDLKKLEENAGKNYVDVSEDTVFLLNESRKLSELTEGKFDCTIGPLTKLWNIKNEKGNFPSEDELAHALSLVNYEDVLIKNNKSVMLRKEGMSISFGAIAKGYIADKTADFLTKKGINSALIDLGGNIVLLGEKPEGSPYKIGVRDPDGESGDYLGIVEASNTSLVSSGAYERFFVYEGTKYHHIFDLDTGLPIENELMETTIISQKSFLADGFSTAAFIMGLDKGFDLINKTEGMEGIFVAKDKSIYVTDGIAEQFVLSNNKYKICRYVTGISAFGSGNFSAPE